MQNDTENNCITTTYVSANVMIKKHM